MKKSKKSLIAIALVSLLAPTIAYAVPAAPPSGGPGGQGSPGGSSSANISYKGAATFTSNTEESSKTYSSTTGSQNALLVSSGTSTINSCTVTKSGDSSDENSDFYGTNAAILVYNGATLNIKGGTITTNGSHANGVFAYGEGTINISDAKINTTGNNSGGVMVTGGGTLTATNLNVKTAGNSSASIRSDRGGGTLTVKGGTYETSGTGSPAIYSTADITVNDATLTSTASEGVVVEGANSVTLNNTTLTDTNNTLNGNSETYKNIFLYQSMSGDADEGKATFTAKNSTITTNKGDTIFVTNTTAEINLEHNTIKNTDGDFLRIQTGKWGNSGSNGGNVTLNMTNQEVEGNIIVDSISTLNLTLKDKSLFKGSIDTDNQAKEVNVTLSKNSVIVLTADTYLDSLTNEVSDNSNIYLNGHKLYVNGKTVSANEGPYGENTSADTTDKVVKEDNNYLYYIIGGVVAVVIIGGIIIFIKKKNRKK
ncbi:MAG: hypothetical protein IJ093_03125, partial [Bacilli bacterium]|nr:hypothetical protein [Bacilli bacterium]